MLQMQAPGRLKPLPVIAELAALLLVQSPAGGQGASSPGSASVTSAELQVVDCLLPGQVRVLGGRTYLTPRRPTRTTGADCAARGGEYLAYDRAEYRSALEIWLPAAEAGAPDAQTIVGEIYERGLDGVPDYESASRWYRRAAEQGFTRAQFNLGTLYEQGLGVPVDRLEALNWFRLASGLSQDSVIYQSAALADREAARTELNEQISRRDQQIEVLRREIESLNQQLGDRTTALDDVRENIESLRELLEQVETERDRAVAELAAVPEPVPAALTGRFTEPERISYQRSDFGRFYALIIGVQEYEVLDDLASPANDAARIGRLLRDRYGFSVLTLADPDQLALMRAINDLYDTLREDDNLLIYFSGHGRRLPSGMHETGYWLPRNAEPPPDDALWVPNDFVSRHLGRLDARRVLVIADSCYTGLLGDDPGYVMVGEGRYSDEYIAWKRPKRSRLVLSSGSDSPVLAEHGEANSLFARALLEVLETNDQVLTAPELFLRIRERVRTIAAAGLAREPALKALKNAGHEVGDFFFIVASS